MTPFFFGASEIDSSMTGERESVECVILLHGLCRSARSMRGIEHHLRAAGFDVLNLDYASTRNTIEEIAALELGAAIRHCQGLGYQRIHIVSHSMGGLVARYYLQDHRLPPGSRVVMLAPPNQGSELTDVGLTYFPAVYNLAGPAATQLSVAPPRNLGLKVPLAAEVGIIAGSLSFNPLCSALLPGPDDGRVAVQRTMIPEMRDFRIVPHNHLSLLHAPRVHAMILYFLQNGGFED